jgi:hypothetical protein
MHKILGGGVNFKMDARKGFYYIFSSNVEPTKHIHMLIPFKPSWCNVIFYMWTPTFNQNIFEQLNFMCITLHMLPLEYQPVEVTIVTQINIMFTFDNTNKTKHVPCLCGAFDLEEVVPSSYADYKMSWPKKVSIPLNSKFMCPKLGWKMLISSMTLLMRHVCSKSRNQQFK